MIPILCDETDRLTSLVIDKTNGLGRLECISAKVNEVANGKYVAEIVYPVNGEHFKDLRTGGIVKLKPNDLSSVQLFRIYKISKPLNGAVTISLNHISYDLNKTSVLPFSATGATSCLQAIKDNMVLKNSYPFIFTTTLENQTSQMTLARPQSARACLGGVEGSFLDTFGFVQFEWDNLEVKALAHRGTDRGVRLAYGKNITDIKQDENIESMYTAVMPYVVRNDTAIMGNLQTIVSTSIPKVLNLDLSSYFDSDEEVTAAQINAKAQQYIQDNDLASPNISIDVSFVALWQTEEYKDIAPLERVGLFDTVKVSFSPLGIEATAMVTEYVYDVIQERYESIHIGNYRSSLSNTITQMINTDIKKSDQSEFIGTMTNVILNSLGLFSTKIQKANGGYQYYLHNRPTLAESQYQWTINAGGFALSQDYGQTWTAGIDTQGNAVFNSLAANIVRAMEIYGTYIEGATIKGTNIEGSTIKGSTVSGTSVEALALTFKPLNASSGFGGIAPLGIRVDGVTYNGLQLDTGALRLNSQSEVKVQGGSNNNGSYITIKENEITITAKQKLNLYINGSGYTDLTWINLGNGHVALGK